MQHGFLRWRLVVGELVFVPFLPHGSGGKTSRSGPRRIPSDAQLPDAIRRVSVEVRRRQGLSRMGSTMTGHLFCTVGRLVSGGEVLDGTAAGMLPACPSSQARLRNTTKDAPGAGLRRKVLAGSRVRVRTRVALLPCCNDARGRDTALLIGMLREGLHLQMAMTITGGGAPKEKPFRPAKPRVSFRGCCSLHEIVQAIPPVALAFASSSRSQRPRVRQLLGTALATAPAHYQQAACWCGGGGRGRIWTEFISPPCPPSAAVTE
jgi:hypothetical protein